MIAIFIAILPVWSNPLATPKRGNLFGAGFGSRDADEYGRGRDAHHHGADQSGADLFADESGAEGERSQNVAELADLPLTYRELESPGAEMAEARQQPDHKDL